jgi:hypothetical protein
MIDVALVSGVAPLGDVEVHLGGSTPAEGRRRGGTFLVQAVVRHGLEVRSLSVKFEDAGKVHLHDHVKYSAGMVAVSPAQGLPYVLEVLGPIPGSEHVRDLLERAGPAGHLEVAPVDEPAPHTPNELKVFLDARPFPGSGLTQAELERLGLEVPRSLRAMAESTSVARARIAAAEFARREVGRLAGTPIEARVRRIAEAAELVLGWAGQRPRAGLVRSWRELPLGAHPLALDLVEAAVLQGPALAPDAAFVRAQLRPELATQFLDASSRRDLLRLELGASIAATMEVSFTHRDFREELPPRHVLFAAALASADAAISPDGLRAERAAPAGLEVLASRCTQQAASRAAELGARSVGKLAEAALREPVRAWAVGDLDEIVEPTYFTHGAPR